MEDHLPQQTTTTDSDVPQAPEEQQQGATPTPQAAEAVQQPSAREQRPVAAFPQMMNKTDAHSITIRSAVRIFEDAKISRSPRTIANWCKPNTESVNRLDCWQDPKDHAYYITQQSIEHVIEEETAKGRVSDLPQSIRLHAEEMRQSTASQRRPASQVPRDAEMESDQVPQSHDDRNELRELRRKTVEHEYTIKGKDIVIEQMQKAWDKLAERLEKQSELVGGLRLENQQLKQIEAPRQSGQGTEAQAGEDSADNHQQPIWEVPTDQAGDADEEENH